MKRNEKIDYYKGLVAFLVLYGHIVQLIFVNETGDVSSSFSDAVIMFIYAFHMPLFMFLSGYCLNYYIHKPLRHTLIKRSFLLIVPALFWATINYFMRILIGYDQFALNILPSKLTVSGEWFLWVLVFFNGIVVLLFLFSKKLYWVFGIIIEILLLFGTEYISQLKITAYLFPFYLFGFIYLLKLRT